MTRRDYILLAEALAASKPRTGSCIDEIQGAESQHTRDCAAVANMLASQSRGFDKALFMRNCEAQQS